MICKTKKEKNIGGGGGGGSKPNPAFDNRRNHKPSNPPPLPPYSSSNHQQPVSTPSDPTTSFHGLINNIPPLTITSNHECINTQTPPPPPPPPPTITNTKRDLCRRPPMAMSTNRSSSPQDPPDPFIFVFFCSLGEQSDICVISACEYLCVCVFMSVRERGKKKGSNRERESHTIFYPGHFGH